jgi:cell division protein FtsW
MNEAGYFSDLGRRHKPDYWLLILSALLLTIGLVVVYSISPGLAASQHLSQGYFVGKQFIGVVLGLVAFMAAAHLPLKRWGKLINPLAIAAAVGSIIVMITPLNDVYQAHRWIRLGSFSFQIAELIKLALVLWLASFLATRAREGKIDDSQAVLVPILVLLLFLGVLVGKFQSDLGSAGVMVMILTWMAYAADVPLKRIGLIAAAIALFVFLAIFSTGYRRDRVTSFLHPNKNCQTTSYQACQALIAVGSGGLVGQGLGYGVEAYGYLPESSNDSIFAIIAEKFGFVGTTIVVLIYALFIRRLYEVIVRTSDLFSRLICVGVLAWLSTQMIINIGAMIGLLPLKGITLPLISQGGTSLVCLTAALGLVYQLSRYTSYSKVSPDENNKTAINYSLNRRRLGRSHNTPVVTRPRA